MTSSGTYASRLHDRLAKATPYMTLDDSLLDRLKDGDAAAYEILVEQFEGPLYRFLLCSHGNHHLAQEQSAETFAQLVRSLPNMKGGCQQLRPFVFAVARNVQRRQWRKRNKTHLPLAIALDKSDDRPSPAQEASDREQLQRALSAIRCLREPVRTVMVLRFVEHLSLEEIAESLQIPMGTVKSHIHRGRARLKQTFAEEECET